MSLPSVMKRVSSTELHKDTAPTLRRLSDDREIAITHYNNVDGYLIAPDRYEELTASAVLVDELKGTFALLLAAAKADVSIPSETLDRLLPNRRASDWRDIAEFAAQFPVTLTHGEHGEPITRGRLRASAGYFEESGSDDDLNLD